MASTRDLVINIVGNGQSAADAFDKVGDAATRQEGKFTKLKAGITIASAAIVAGVTKFAADSVAAYSEAEQSQAALEAAYAKFPGVTSVSIDALRALNTEIQRKTGFDDDALAASQATLAQFGLTGEQIQQLTPLMADYATKTGKDLATAAEDMGKAVMGQGRALKQVGVEFSDTGDKAGNFEQLVAGLDGTVGGFATTMGETAAGKAQILAQNFGDIQETVGQMLIPALTTLTEIGSQVTAWMADNPAVVQAAAIAVGVLTAAIVAANIAMWAMAANPIVLTIMAIILAVGLLVAGIWLLVSNWDAVVAWITGVWGGFVGWITGVINGFVGWWNGIWAAVGRVISNVWQNNIVKPISTAWTWVQNIVRLGLASLKAGWDSVWGAVGRFISDVWNNRIVAPIRAAWTWVQNAVRGGLTAIRTVWSSVWNGLGGIVRGVWNGVLGWIESGVNGAIRIINGMIGAVNSVAGVVGIQIGLIPSVRIPRLATGTVTSGPMLAMIGDNPGGREVVAPYDSYVEEIRRAAGVGGTGTGRLNRADLDYLIKGIARQRGVSLVVHNPVHRDTADSVREGASMLRTAGLVA
jgi:hypothetical protein